MDKQQDEQAVEDLLHRYSQAISASRSDLIPDFYTTDALFMPEGYKPLTRETLAGGNPTPFIRNKYLISFSIENVVIDHHFAFVNAAAQTKMIDLKNGGETTKLSKDFFVLQEYNEEWRIFRYMFNNQKEQTAPERIKQKQ
ncbi:hypothetical protein GS399_09235 [Pedobacter sp. HMF7647]|uniref:DUF4440 domain-containing protein n=1 Tax=Hufsiella arboris TaxID=2695275 RepID=A0A7K1Y9Y1_9SPHI|nr:hypothetical protein [Hufsiella arboris]MXV51151.1 hypothetical protein [Hufsiella arboris]